MTNSYKHGAQRWRRQGFLLPCQLITLFSCILAVSVWGLKITREPAPDQLLQEGHRAMARGDYERATALYERAELRGTNPADVAFYLASAKFHLAMRIEGLSGELLEAEQLFRCCLDKSDPHRPHALCGLGNCLLLKAGSSDEGSLRSAIACYDQCLQCAGEDKALASAARHNREKARLLLLQFIPPIQDSTSERPPRDDFPPRFPRPQDLRRGMPLTTGDAGADGNADPQSAQADAKQNQGNDTAKNNEPPHPGKGNLPPIPDDVDAPPISPQVAIEHLELAAQKVLQESQSHQRRDEESSAKGVRDW